MGKPESQHLNPEEDGKAEGSKKRRRVLKSEATNAPKKSKATLGGGACGTRDENPKISEPMEEERKTQLNPETVQEDTKEEGEMREKSIATLARKAQLNPKPVEEDRMAEGSGKGKMAVISQVTNAEGQMLEKSKVTSAKEEMLIKDEDEDDDEEEKYPVLPNMVFCPYCANLMQDHKTDDKFWLRCPTCPFQIPVQMPFVLADTPRLPPTPPRVRMANDREDSEKSKETCLECGVGKMIFREDNDFTSYHCDNEDCNYEWIED